MANIKSAKKRIRTSEKARVRNLGRKRAAKSSVKDVIKKAIGEKKSVLEIKEELSRAYKSVDKAAAKGAIHRNRANRMKSRMMNQINRAGVRGK
ncbi:MAG: 30S ribosomal protein S20 [Patescibacteria group bacterium]